jgi:hypothetical protein
MPHLLFASWMRFDVEELHDFVAQLEFVPGAPEHAYDVVTDETAACQDKECPVCDTYGLNYEPFHLANKLLGLTSCPRCRQLIEVHTADVHFCDGKMELQEEKRGRVWQGELRN